MTHRRDFHSGLLCFGGGLCKGFGHQRLHTPRPPERRVAPFRKPPSAYGYALQCPCVCRPEGLIVLPKRSGVIIERFRVGIYDQLIQPMALDLRPAPPPELDELLIRVERNDFAGLRQNVDFREAGVGVYLTIDATDALDDVFVPCSFIPPKLAA